MKTLSKYPRNKALDIPGWEHNELMKHLSKQQSRTDIHISGHYRGFSFLSTQKQYQGYLLDDKY